MKFTSFNPLIVTKDSEAAISLFEALGFEKIHRIEAKEDNGTDITTVCMKNENGFRVDVAQANGVERDLTLIRMNVDNFEEAFEWLKSKGFRPAREETLDTRTNKSTMMISPSGYAFDLCQHIKD